MRVVLKLAKWLILLAVILFAGFAVYVRFVPDDIAAWHVDPADVAEISPGNAYLITPDGAVGEKSPVFPMAEEALAARFQEAALAAPRTKLLSDEGGFTTYVQRSEIMAYPDYITVRAVSVEGGSALYVYSRSRFGSEDFGVNEARVSAWLNGL